LEDKELLDKILDPNSKNYGFNMLVRKYQQRVYWHIRKMVIDHDDADDLTQETFIKVFKHIHTFRKDSGLYTWIYRIATNECLNFLQRKKRRFFLPIGDIENELAEKLTSSAYISADDVQLQLQRALLKLPDKQRLVFNMKYFDDLSYEEISEITKTSVGALKASYHHAVKKIEDSLKQFKL
jgi:RNA polymerase sigma-70 factor (ECF subfamily)